MQLSPNFTLAELTVSQTAIRRGLSNRPNATQIKALRLVCETVLEPVHAHFGKRVVVTSGFRAPAVNQAIGGSGTSQHCFGEAVDFTVPGVSNMEVCQWIAANLVFDQLIYEFGEAGWVHCSFSAKRSRGQTLTARRKRAGGTAYLPGLKP